VPKHLSMLVDHERKPRFQRVTQETSHSFSRDTVFTLDRGGDRVPIAKRLQLPRDERQI